MSLLNNSGKLFTIGTADFIKGLILAIILPILQVIKDLVDTGSLSFDWKMIGTLAISGFVGYLLKNLLTNSNDQFMSKEPPTN